MKLSFSLNASDLFISLSIFVIPFLFFLYNIFPPLEKVTIFSHEIDFSIHLDLEGMAYYYALRLLTLSLLSLWYISCRYKWNKLILLLAINEIYYITSAALELLTSNMNIEKFNQIPTASITLIVFAFYYLIISKFRSWFLRKEDQKIRFYQSLRKEINTQMKANTNLSLRRSRQIKKELAALRDQKQYVDKRMYLKELMKLREAY